MYASVPANKTVSFKSREIHNSDMSTSQCLTFYYYIIPEANNASVEVSWQDSQLISANDEAIVKVYPKSMVKWHKIEKSFKVLPSNFTVSVLFLSSLNILFCERFN